MAAVFDSLWRKLGTLGISLNKIIYILGGRFYLYLMYFHAF